MAHWLKRTKDQIADRVAWPEGSVADEGAPDERASDEERREPPDATAEDAEPVRHEPDPGA